MDLCPGGFSENDHDLIYCFNALFESPATVRRETKGMFELPVSLQGVGAVVYAVHVLLRY